MTTVSLVLTIHNRSPEVSKAVADSFRLPGNQVDELVLVMDRPTNEARLGAADAYAGLAKTLQLPAIDGPPGWLCPAKAWNAGFHAATSDLLYLISSEVVQEPHNVSKAVALAKNLDCAVFGSCHDSEKEALVVGAEPGLLVSSKMPRPLGFIVCLPRKAVNFVRGFDEAFMDGFWFDDDDFFLRLWHDANLDFVFSDTIHGTHLSHPRPDLSTPEGQAKIARNRSLMIRKHGTDHPWPVDPKHVWTSEGLTRWTHI